MKHEYLLEIMFLEKNALLALPQGNVLQKDLTKDFWRPSPADTERFNI